MRQCFVLPKLTLNSWSASLYFPKARVQMCATRPGLIQGFMRVRQALINEHSSAQGTVTLKNRTQLLTFYHSRGNQDRTGQRFKSKEMTPPFCVRRTKQRGQGAGHEQPTRCQTPFQDVLYSAGYHLTPTSRRPHTDTGSI